MRLNINLLLFFSLLSIVYAIDIELHPSQTIHKRDLSQKEDSPIDTTGLETTASHLQYSLHTNYDRHQYKSAEKVEDTLPSSNQMCYVLEIDIIDPSYQMSIAFILLSIGFYFMIFGIGWLKITSILTGFVTFSLMAWIGLPYPERGCHKVIYLFSDLCFGVIGGFIFKHFDLLSICFIGGLGGGFIAMYLVSSSLLVAEVTFVPFHLIFCLCLTFGILYYLNETYCFILSTSFIGSYLVAKGLSLLFLPSFQGIDLFPDTICHQNTTTSAVMAHVIVILLFMGSYGWQYYWTIITKEFYVNKEGAVFLS